VGKLKLVGIGPGSPEYITPIAQKSVQNAEIVIGAKRAISLLQDHIKGESVQLTAQNLKKLLKYAVKSAGAGKNVVILSTGDPGFSGLLGSLINVAGKEIEADVIPGVSSIQVCAARLSISWDTSGLFSFHGGTSHEEKMKLIKALKKEGTVILFPDSKSFSPLDIAKFLIEHGIDRGISVGVCENLTLPKERTVISTLDGILKQSFDPLCVMAIGAGIKQKELKKAESD
jgi:cobalt-precorrin-7 (C5)-methyltransferase